MIRLVSIIGIDILLVLITRSCSAESKAVNETGALTRPHDSPKIIRITARPGYGGKTYTAYHPVFLTVELHAKYQNPFDPAQIRLDAEIKGPDGIHLRMPGFLYRPYRVQEEGDTDAILPAGHAEWQVRFTPTRPGLWSYTLSLRDQNGEAMSSVSQLVVQPSTSPGFIRRSARNPLYFAWDNGNPYFAIGENMVCDESTTGEWFRDYTTWLTELGKAGGNWIRLWMASWSCAIEWTPEKERPATVGEYHGMGVYNLGNAWKLDQIMDIAARNHINVMLTLGNFSEFVTNGYFHNNWNNNPYNQKNGGPCATPNDFWTNPVAQSFYKRRLRYLIARYSYRTNLQSWEFWNETNAPVFWVAKMSAYLKQHDPYHHLITTTYGDRKVWRLPDIDFSQTHTYGDGSDISDHAPIIHCDVGLNTALYHKPHLVSEFGIDDLSNDAVYDPKGLGINLHNGLWAATMSGAAGGAMIWYWDSYVQPKNLYHEFKSLASFADTIAWTAHRWRSARVNRLHVQEVRSSRGRYHPLVIPANTGWGKVVESSLVATPMGVRNDVPLASFLYGKLHADLRTTPKLVVNYPKAGTFTVLVHQVSDWGDLRIWLDGKLALNKTLRTAPGEGDFKKTAYDRQWKIYRAIYDSSYSIPVPAGPHVIRLENAGSDWISLNGIILNPYMSKRYVNCYGLQDDHIALLWFHNPAHNWKNAYEGKPCPPIAGATVVLHGLKDGDYTLQWWNTETGKPFRVENAVSRSGELPITLPEITSDVALKVFPVRR